MALGQGSFTSTTTTPHLRQLLVDKLTELVSGFVEGRYSISGFATDEFSLIELGNVLVDGTANEKGEKSRFNCLSEYVPESFLEELAKQLMATYAVEVSVVEGSKMGLLLKAVDTAHRA